jgi:hypothetical protein
VQLRRLDRRRASLEHYRQVTPVFERQSPFEADRLSAGFSLEEFTSAEATPDPAPLAETVH